MWSRFGTFGSGELFNHIVELGHYTEQKAAECFRSILSVVVHCHRRDRASLPQLCFAAPLRILAPHSSVPFLIAFIYCNLSLVVMLSCSLPLTFFSTCINLIQHGSRASRPEARKLPPERQHQRGGGESDRLRPQRLPQKGRVSLCVNFFHDRLFSVEHPLSLFYPHPPSRYNISPDLPLYYRPTSIIVI